MIEVLFLMAGADLGLSQEGLDFQKSFENLKTFFFDQIDFQSSPKAVKRRKTFEKTGQKKPFLGTFWKILTKKSRFFLRALPLKVSIYWHRRPF